MNVSDTLASVRLSVDFLIFLDEGGQGGERILESRSSQDQAFRQIVCENGILNFPSANFISPVFKNFHILTELCLFMPFTFFLLLKKYFILNSVYLQLSEHRIDDPLKPKANYFVKNFKSLSE